MDGTASLQFASLAAVASVAVLRVSWAQPRRAALLNAAGWGLIALAALFGWLGAGAWGAAVATLAGMAAAGIALAAAAAAASKGLAAASKRRVRMLPEVGEPLRLGRRLVTFLITVPLALIVSIALALAVRGFAGALGAGEADSIVLAFFAAPLAWGILVHLLLIQRRRRGQWLALLVGTLPALPVVLTGVFQ